MRTIKGYSVAGTGLVLRGLRRRDDGTSEQPLFEVTLWLAVLYLPLVPLRRWKATYLGEATPPDMNMDRSLLLAPVERLPPDPLGALRTFAVAIFAIFAALAPPYFCFEWMAEEADSDLVMLLKLVCTIGSIFWPLGVILWGCHWQRRTAEEEPRPPGSGLSPLPEGRGSYPTASRSSSGTPA